MPDLPDDVIWLEDESAAVWGEQTEKSPGQSCGNGGFVILDESSPLPMGFWDEVSKPLGH